MQKERNLTFTEEKKKAFYKELIRQNKATIPQQLLPHYERYTAEQKDGANKTIFFFSAHLRLPT